MDWKRFYGEPEVDPIAFEAILAVAGFVRRRRLTVGMSQTQLARRAGVSQSTVSRIEHGQMPYATLAVVARILRPLIPG